MLLVRKAQNDFIGLQSSVLEDLGMHSCVSILKEATLHSAIALCYTGKMKSTKCHKTKDT